MALPSGRSADCTAAIICGMTTRQTIDVALGRPTSGDRRPALLRRRRAAPLLAGLPDAPAPRAPLEGHTEADLAIVGGGLSGLWAALQAKQIDPHREVVLLEAEAFAYGATGRSGGFISSSLTHGVANGLSRFPDEMPLLERLGRQNFDRTVVALGQFEIDCDLELNGDLAVALEPHEERWLAEEAEQLRAARPRRGAARPGCRARRARLTDLPRRPVAAQRRRDPRPGASSRGASRDAATSLGVRLHEHTPVTRLRDAGGLRSSCARRAASVRAAAGAAGDRRLPVAAALRAQPDRAGLGLRARDRAAHAGAAVGDRLGANGRA